MKKIITLTLILKINFLSALEVKCQFEEVYKNGEIQQGFFLLKGENIRYEYFNKNLFKIIKADEDFVLVENSNSKNFTIIDHNLELLKELINISKNFPNVQQTYQKDNITITLEKSLENNFFKRIAIISNKLNLSIYLDGCNFDPINNLFFKYDPVFDYTFK